MRSSFKVNDVNEEKIRLKKPAFCSYRFQNDPEKWLWAELQHLEYQLKTHMTAESRSSSLLPSLCNIGFGKANGMSTPALGWQPSWICDSRGGTQPWPHGDSTATKNVAAMYLRAWEQHYLEGDTHSSYFPPSLAICARISWKQDGLRRILSAFSPKLVAADCTVLCVH